MSSSSPSTPSTPSLEEEKFKKEVLDFFDIIMDIVERASKYNIETKLNKTTLTAGKIMIGANNFKNIMIHFINQTSNYWQEFKNKNIQQLKDCCSALAGDNNITKDYVQEINIFFDDPRLMDQEVTVKLWTSCHKLIGYCVKFIHNERAPIYNEETNRLVYSRKFFGNIKVKEMMKLFCEE